jgi:catechol 2,3-dioxygenase-like lactoylglutathione lyase family enzyme
VIHHLTIRVKDLSRAQAWYAQALAPLGYKKVMEFPGFVGLGAPAPDLWLAEYQECTPMHVALAATSPAQVQAFYDAAMAAGGTDNGPPGPRPDYGPDYYGAFVLDPEGNNIEAALLKLPAPSAKAGAGKGPMKSSKKSSKPAKQKKAKGSKASMSKKPAPKKPAKKAAAKKKSRR